MPSLVENEVELIHQKNLENEFPESGSPLYPSAPPDPEGPPDMETNPPPPTYEEATDPNFLKRFQNFVQPPRQSSQTSTDEPEETCCFVNVSLPLFDRITHITFISEIIICLVGFLVAPLPMIIVGSVFLEACGDSSPYPMWLLVGGVSAWVTFFYLCFLCCLLAVDIENIGLICCGVIFVIFSVVWYFFGCYYVWGLWDGNGNFIYGDECGSSSSFEPVCSGAGCGSFNSTQPTCSSQLLETSCVYPYYFALSLVVSPLILLCLAVALCFGVFMSICFAGLQGAVNPNDPTYD